MQCLIASTLTSTHLNTCTIPSFVSCSHKLLGRFIMQHNACYVGGKMHPGTKEWTWVLFLSQLCSRAASYYELSFSLPHPMGWLLNNTLSISTGTTSFLPYPAEIVLCVLAGVSTIAFIGTLIILAATCRSQSSSKKRKLPQEETGDTQEVQ